MELGATLCDIKVLREMGSLVDAKEEPAASDPYAKAAAAMAAQVAAAAKLAEEAKQNKD